LAGAFHQRTAVYLFGRRVPSARRRLFVWPAHSISAPPFLCSAGDEPRRILFRLPAHSPPTHRFGVAVRPAHLIAAPHSLSFGRRIRRRSAYLMLFRLAGAFPAEPPPIWCCSVWPAHPPPSRHRFGVVSFGRRIPRQFGLFVCRRIPRQPTDLVLLHLAGASPRCATIACLGWHIPMPIFSPAHPLAASPSLFWPAHSFATPPLLSAGVFIRRAALLLSAGVLIRCAAFLLSAGVLIRCAAFLLSAGVFIRRATLLLPACAFIRHAALAFGRRIYSPCPSPFFDGASPRRATIAIFRRRIPSPCLHHLSRSAHPIAAPPYRISLHARKQQRVSVSAIIENHGASHRRTSIAYLGLRFGRRNRLDCRAAMNHPHWAGALAVDC
jgi:hypothetical protein